MVIKKTSCAICSKPVTDAALAPFCSDRCKMVDLNRWLSGVYAIPAVENDAEEEDAVEQANDEA